jgi:hypothetical protein
MALVGARRGEERIERRGDAPDLAASTRVEEGGSKERRDEGDEGREEAGCRREAGQRGTRCTALPPLC